MYKHIQCWLIMQDHRFNYVLGSLSIVENTFVNLSFLACFHSQQCQHGVAGDSGVPNYLRALGICLTLSYGQLCTRAIRHYWNLKSWLWGECGRGLGVGAIPQVIEIWGCNTQHFIWKHIWKSKHFNMFPQSAVPAWCGRGNWSPNYLRALGICLTLPYGRYTTEQNIQLPRTPDIPINIHVETGPPRTYNSAGHLAYHGMAYIPLRSSQGWWSVSFIH